VKLYRAEILNFGDEDRNQFELGFRTFENVKETEKSYVIKINRKSKVIPKHAKKMFANTNKELALNDLYHRTLRSINICMSLMNYQKEKLKFLDDKM
jgi:hypothetical protein